MIIEYDEHMTSKILFWFGSNYTHFCLSYYLQKKLDSQMYAIIDVTEKPKFIKRGRKVNKPKINIFGNKNK